MPNFTKKIYALKSAKQSAKAYVRALIEREHSQREQVAAAQAYRAFLQTHPEERAELEMWERACLV